MTWFRGQKVTMIRKGRWSVSYGERQPEFGVVYTIREIETGHGGTAFRFVEIVNAPLQYMEGGLECTWDSGNFRPVVESHLPESITACLTTDHKLREPALT